MKSAAVEAAFLLAGTGTVVVMRAHVRAISPRRARRHRRKRDAGARFEIRHADDGVGLDADGVAVGARGEAVVVAVAAEISEDDARFLVLVVEKGLDGFSGFAIAVLVALNGSWLMATVTGWGKGRKKDREMPQWF